MSEFKTTVPFTKIAAVTPSDGSNLPANARSLYIEVAGDIRFETIDGDEATLAVPDNFYLLGQIQKVFATSTTATGIFALR